MSEVRAGVYRHFKGNLYRVICVAKHSETMEEMVVYWDTTADAKVWVRPLSMWGEAVNAGGEAQPRFRFLAPGMDELDGAPMFRLIEAIAGNMEQYRRFGEHNVLRFYHRLTGAILTVDEGLLSALEDGGDAGGVSPERVADAEKVLARGDDYLRLPDDDVDEYDQMGRFIEKLPIAWRGDLERAIRGKGALRRFKEAAARLGVLEDWHRQLAAARRRKARLWCDENGIAWWRDLI